MCVRRSWRTDGLDSEVPARMAGETLRQTEANTAGNEGIGVMVMVSI
jgi:hypothetical protein